MEGVLFFFGVIFLFGFTAWHVISYEFRKAEAKEKAEREELERELEEEKRKPMFRIVFELANGSKEYMEFMEPRIILDRICKSHEFAKKVLEKCYETGRFRNDKMITFPTCNVAKAWLEKEDEFLVKSRNENGQTENAVARSDTRQHCAHTNAVS